ncbi:Fanconi anemia core complex-associated protein 100 [Liparis tanakae]|uniref:Fanconi anemia core complex-associated protein 100 n=1 Tax=Liparis tanakae TaxID=230148 RepID=A0A4Z2FDW9_9TELE|nr:Fanconi anemia core complex-associated protein 100 [Liparis tanakae]
MSSAPRKENSRLSSSVLDPLLTYFRVMTSSSSTWPVAAEFIVSAHNFCHPGDTAGTTGTRRRPLLICVHSGAVAAAPSTPEVSGGGGDGHLCLEPVLFKLLFGIDAALAKSPVVLCGLPDGCLCFLPLRPPAPRLKVLHSLEQPVAFIGASGGATDAGPGHARCLVAVGERGRVVLIKSEKGGGGNRSVFIEGCVQGPVACGCVDATRLYYSTGSDLLALDLSEVSPERDGHGGDVETSGVAAALRSPASLNVCRVVALAEPTRSAAGEVQLLGLSVRGQLQRITVPVEREDAGLPGGPPTRGGRGVRDLLSAIGDVCERASVLKTAIKSQNQILRRLNQVLNISFLLLAGGTNPEERLPSQEKPIRCRATAGWSRLLQRDFLNLTCVLENSSPYVLERGWTLSVAVLPLSRPPGAGTRSSSSSASFPLHSLPPGETFEASLPLAAAGEASFPVTVSCSLDFSLGGLLGEDAERLPGPRGGCVSLPLSTLTVDWLHALQVCGPISTRGKAAPQRRNATDAVDAFLRARRVSGGRGGGGEGGGEGERERGRHSASVRVSSELLRDALAARGSDPDARGSSMAVALTVGLCLSLLEWLLADAPGGVAAARRGDRGDHVAAGGGGSVVRGHDPNGHAVQLTAKEVNVGEESTAEGEEPLSAVEVQVESSSLAAVCGLHHALLRRIQALLHTAPERAASPKRIQSLRLREALQRAERLLQQIRQSRISGAFGGGVSTGPMTQSLLSVYQELRENPLLIM